MTEFVASRAPRWSRRGSVREINKVQCYTRLETKVKEKRFLLSYIIRTTLYSVSAALSDHRKKSGYFSVAAAGVSLPSIEVESATEQ